MPKRPRTAESVDAISASTSSRWSLGRRLPGFPSSISTTNNIVVTSPSLSQQVNSNFSRHRHSHSVNNESSAAPLQKQQHLVIQTSAKPSESKSQRQQSPQTLKSPTTVAKELVQSLHSLLTGRLNRTNNTLQGQKELNMDDLASFNADALKVGPWTPDQEYESHLRIREEYSKMMMTTAAKEEDDTMIEDDVEMNNSDVLQASEPSDEGSSSSSSSSSSIDDTSIPHPSQAKLQHPPSHHNQARPTLEHYDVLETLGTGSFGRVLLVKTKGENPDDAKNYFAMKVLNKSQIVRLKQVEHINSERAILSKVDHPFIVHLEDTFQDSLNCYMMMEFVVGGEIFSHLRRAKKFSADVTRFYIATLLLAIAHLHSKRIIYRDLKPENLLIDSKGYIKITDFGFSKELVDTDRTWTLCGTPEYLSPEVILSRSQSFASDYWCLGILMYEMLCGHPPFYDATPFGTYEKILAADIRFPSHVDPVARDLISSLLAVDVTKRLGNLRGGAKDVMNHPWFHRVNWDLLLKKEIQAPFIPHQMHPSDSSNFEKYGHYDLSNMPGIHIGMQADQQDQQSDPWKELFTEF